MLCGILLIRAAYQRRKGKEAAGTGEEGKVGTRKGGREYPQQRGGGPGPGDQ